MRSVFNKAAGRPATFLKETPTQVFFVETVKFLRVPILKKTPSIVHCYISLEIQGLYIMTPSGFSDQVTGLF